MGPLIKKEGIITRKAVSVLIYRLFITQTTELQGPENITHYQAQSVVFIDLRNCTQV